VLGVTDELQSTIQNEKRLLNIYLPDGYAKDTAHYPVIYVLDGSADEDFVHITGIVQFMTMLGLMPPTMVVGIANVDRRRDYTFPTTIDSDKVKYPTTGHSARFISYVEKEVVPHIEHNYRVNGSKMLIGQSLGGLVATEILLKKPELFTGYLIVSPSLWWDAESLLKGCPGQIKNMRNRDVNINIIVGRDEPEPMVQDATRLVEQLHNYGKPKFHIYYRILEGESHLTILHNAVYKVLMMLNGHEKK
jgi:predicted alpha/beta superfamily hydrolase